jgi:putative membrane protein
MTPADALPAVPVGIAAAAYGVGALRLQRRGDRWPLRRSLALLGGLGCVALALLPPLGAEDERFPVHVAQHLLLASAAPVLLALAAPVTLALRTLPGRGRRVLLRLVRSRFARLALHPLVVLLLATVPLVLLYGTSLYAATLDSPPLHAAVHAHMLAAGCLLAWYLVGADPLPHDRVRVRLAVLVLVGAVHGVLAKGVYAAGLPGVSGPAPAVRAGAELLFAGGDAAELLLAVVLLAQWYARGSRALARERRRAGAVAAVSSRTPPPAPGR